MNEGTGTTTNLKSIVAPSRMARQLTGGNVQEGMFNIGATESSASIGEEEPAGEQPVNVCMIGTGEYTTGYVYGEAAKSDKSAGGESEDASTIENLFFLE